MRNFNDPARNGERGIAALWVAMLLTLLMAFAAMAVDLGLWYVERSEAQNATDAAALAGAAMLPTDPVAAVDEAERVAGQHGYEASEVTAVVVGRGQLEVRIDSEVRNFFLPTFGLSETTTIGTSALAEYEGSVTMGSPGNTLGDNPEAAAGFVQPEFVLGIAGPDHKKEDGDRYSTRVCKWSNQSWNPSVSNCAGRAGPNHEFDQDGYFFSVDVNETHSGEDLVIQAYDPAYIAPTHTGYGLSCSHFFTLSNGERNSLFNRTATGDYASGGNSIPQGWHDEAWDRYDDGKSTWCPGDDFGHTSRGELQTTFLVRAPDATPWNALDNPILGVDIPSPDCEPVTFGGRFLDWQDNTSSYPSAWQLLNPTDPDYSWSNEWSVDLTDDDWTLAETWHRWAEFCTIPSHLVQEGEYIVQVRTSADLNHPENYDASRDETGVNFYMLRAGFDDGGSEPNFHGGDVTLSARGRLPIFANADSSTPEFFMARILPVSQSRTLTIELFDAGDAAQPGTIQVLPPEDANINHFSNCVFQRDGAGSVSGDPSICKLTNVSKDTGYQGKTVLIDVPIPSSYDCDDHLYDGCWVRLKMVYGSTVTDFTTWGAYVSGDPVRLIE